jgi:hypothetical protein
MKPAFSIRTCACTAGGLLQNGQQWGTQYVQQVQQKVGWFTGSYLNAYFNISKSYGRWLSRHAGHPAIRCCELSADVMPPHLVSVLDPACQQSLAG